MEKNKIKRFYIMPEVWVTVTQSQVFNWVKLVNKNGISTDCISITTNKHSKKEIEEIEESIGGNFIEIKNFKTLIISDLYLSFNLVKFYFRSIIKYDKVIFQTRMATVGLTFSFLKWLPKSKFIFEARAAKNEELKRQTEGGGKTIKLSIQNFFSEMSEKLVNTKSDSVFCVSNTLVNYYLNKYGLNEKKFSVFPGAADSELFFFNKDLRNSVRNELNLDSNEILIVYSGRLEMIWEISDKIFSFFENLYSKDNRFRLLLITPDITIANDLIKKYKFEDITYVTKVKLSEVNKYLNAADVGILLRENILMNNVASPTKFAEYLMSGLPVIISQGVHDFAGDVHKTGYGTVVFGLEEISKIEYDRLIESLKINRKEIANWGKKTLSKESFINRYVNTLIEI